MGRGPLRPSPARCEIGIRQIEIEGRRRDRGVNGLCARGRRREVVRGRVFLRLGRNHSWFEKIREIFGVGGIAQERRTAAREIRNTRILQNDDRQIKCGRRWLKLWGPQPIDEQGLRSPRRGLLRANLREGRRPSSSGWRLDDSRRLRLRGTWERRTRKGCGHPLRPTCRRRGRGRRR